MDEQLWRTEERYAQAEKYLRRLGIQLSRAEARVRSAETRLAAIPKIPALPGARLGTRVAALEMDGVFDRSQAIVAWQLEAGSGKRGAADRANAAAARDASRR